MRTGRFHEEFRTPAGVETLNESGQLRPVREASGSSVACPVFAVAAKKNKAPIVCLMIDVRRYVTVWQKAISRSALRFLVTPTGLEPVFSP